MGWIRPRPMFWETTTAEAIRLRARVERLERVIADLVLVVRAQCGHEWLMCSDCPAYDACVVEYSPAYQCAETLVRWAKGIDI